MSDPIRIWRLGGMRYYEDDIASGLRAATAEALDAVRDAGFTGVWAHVRLRDAARTAVFPSLGDEARQRQQRIDELVRRCADHGLKLYLQLCEPRGFEADDPFWSVHPEARGAAGSSVMDGWDRSHAMCTSAAPTLAFIEQACTDLFSAAPRLGGVVCISASEHLTHCYSHFEVRDAGLAGHFGQKPGDVLTCDRCRTRPPRDVVADILSAIDRGVHRAAPDAHVIAWTWSWDIYDPPPQRELIEKLPGAVIVMSDLERGGALHFRGRTLPVDEYSLIYIGPSERCRGQIEAARVSGHRAMVRFQINHTVEMATAPNLPLPASLYRKFRKLRDIGVTDALTCWNFGCRLDTLNVFAAQRCWDELGQQSEEVFLAALAAEYFGLDDGKSVARAWAALNEAIAPYPFGFGFLYFGPFNCSLAYPLPDHEPRTRSMKIWCFDTDGLGDRLEETLDPLSLRELLDRLEAMSTAWSAAVADYERALRPASRMDRVAAELNVARYFDCLTHSTWTIYTWFAWRYHRTWAPQLTANAVERRLRDELANLEAAERLLAEDDRLGFYEEHQTYYATPEQVRQKRDAITQRIDTVRQTELHREGVRP